MKALSSLVLVSALLLSSGAVASGPIRVVLKLKQKDSMSHLARQVTDPASPRFEKPFTPQEIADALGLSDHDYARLVSALKRRGLSVVHEDKTRSYLIVQGSSAVVEKAFRTHIHFTSEGRHFPDSVAAIPSDLSAVEFVVNLDSRFRLRPRLAATAASTVDAPLGLGPSDIDTLYGFDAIHQQGFFGKGQKIATVAFDAVNPANITAYFSQYNLTPAPTVQVVSVTSTAAVSLCPSQLACDNEAEDDVDLEMAGRVAPAATLISFVGTTDDYLASWVAIFTTILDRGDIFTVNNSDDSGLDPVGSNVQGCEALVAKTGFIPQVDPLFERAVAQGVTVFSASGDNGSDNCGDGTQGIDWPTGPNLVSVGGTDFASDGVTEIGWNGSGGGVSVLYPRPSWQTATPSTFTMRGTPDVALYAGEMPGQAVFTVPLGVGQATWMTVGGTSLSSPTMAGFLAVVNEARLAQGKKQLPYLNPIIYGMSDQDRATSFKDIVAGSNGHYTAAAGWDAVTGLGSPRASALFTYLVAYP